jgi:hypothetical protein
MMSPRCCHSFHPGTVASDGLGCDRIRRIVPYCEGGALCMMGQFGALGETVQQVLILVAARVSMAEIQNESGR